ncbi:MAG: diguanylate cyclase [Proteobacteria bacterium]|nr:diguanylate cyclase [Pseudomonadota bacterium]
MTGRVLIIDDDDEFLMMIRLLLSINSFDVDTANSGEEGLKKLDNSNYDLLLLDVMMPQMSGFEVLKKIRSDEKFIDLPVIMLTAKSEKEDVLEGISLGANDYITKPFETEILIAKMKGLIKLKQLQEELKQKNIILETLAITDGLTGAYNHRYFYKRLTEEFERARRYGTSLSLIMIDIDFFKKINDKYGHLIGDAVLADLAKLLRQNIRKHDVFARYGGEEFAIILPHTNYEGAKHEAERLRKAVENNKFAHVEKEGEVTISLGCVSYPDASAEKPEDLVRFADSALYTAKNSGRNNVKFYKIQ